MATLIDTNKNIRPTEKLRHPEKANNPETEVLRKPKWIRVKAPTSKGYAATRKIVKDKGLVTVCEEAACPNIGECWEKSHATFMILGEICTRACAFCNITTGLPNAVDPEEPAKIGQAVKEMKLQHVVITSVDRDDLADGGAQHFVDVIKAIRKASPKTTIEILTPDFLRKEGATETVIDARPDVFNHNLETVPRLYLKIRPGARYFHSLRLLEKVKTRDPSQFTKSGLMVVKGVQITRQGHRDFQMSNIDKRDHPRGGYYYWMTYGAAKSNPPEGTDLRAIYDGYISVTPLYTDLTHVDSLTKLRAAFNTSG